jgi:hypothetical protein
MCREELLHLMSIPFTHVSRRAVTFIEHPLVYSCVVKSCYIIEHPPDYSCVEKSCYIY